ncbi:MAG: exo-alpha-sialidase [Bacteroidales bacterium]|nr:exo-alpha-sialidase [Bacteroidales bacterium]
MRFWGLGILLAVTTASVASSCRTGVKDGHIVASEVTIAESPAPDSVFLYTPGIVEGFDGRLVVSVDYGGPGTSVLDGSKSDFGDYKTGNQIRVLLSDDEGKTWRETPARIPMMHEILFKAGKSLYMIGHSGRLLITRSDDNGETWSEPSVLCPEPRWHQSCAPVDIHDGKVTLVYEKWVSDGHPWPGVGPVLMQARVDDDLTEASNWKFSDLYNPDEDMEASRPSGIPLTDPGKAGILETNVIRVHDEKNPFYDPTGKSVVLMMRASVGIPDIGVMMKGVERPDGSLAVEKLTRNGREMYFAHIPGADLKFYVVYDPESRLYWLLHSQMDGRMNYRRRLALSYSPDLLKWTFAGLVAVGPADNAARHYASMIIHGDDLLIVSRSGDERARNSHDGNLVTFHRVKNFRDLIY